MPTRGAPHTPHRLGKLNMKRQRYTGWYRSEVDFCGKDLMLWLAKMLLKSKAPSRRVQAVKILANSPASSARVILKFAACDPAAIVRAAVVAELLSE